jgi:TPP-dependent trihydroxycyclohexane-1,2-dione (THcHDO) dehydratase
MTLFSPDPALNPAKAAYVCARTSLVATGACVGTACIVAVMDNNSYGCVNTLVFSTH